MQHNYHLNSTYVCRQFKSLKLLAIDDRLTELGEMTALGIMSSTDLQLLQVLGTVNGSFDPKHLAAILFPDDGSAYTVIGKLLDIRKSVSLAVRQVDSIGLTKRLDPIGLTKRQHTAILEALCDDELRCVVLMCARALVHTLACTHPGIHASLHAHMRAHTPA